MWLRRRTDQQAKYRPRLRQRLRRLRVERTHHRIGRHDRVTATALVGIAPESVGLQVTLLPRMKARPVIRQVMPHQPRIQAAWPVQPRSEEHTSELQSLMRNSYAVFCL